MAQPDFRARPLDINTLVAASQKGPSLAENLREGVKGLQEGVEISSAIGNIIKKRKMAKELAANIKTLSEDPQIKSLSEKTGIPTLSLAKSAVEKPTEFSEMVMKAQPQSSSPFVAVRAELLKEFRADPEKFKKTYGDEGISIIGGKQPDWFSALMNPNASGQ